jgi:hypothetical protein
MGASGPDLVPDEEPVPPAREGGSAVPLTPREARRIAAEARRLAIRVAREFPPRTPRERALDACARGLPALVNPIVIAGLLGLLPMPAVAWALLAISALLGGVTARVWARALLEERSEAWIDWARGAAQAPGSWGGGSRPHGFSGWQR